MKLKRTCKVKRNLEVYSGSWGLSFLKIRSPFLGVPNRRIMEFWDPYWVYMKPRTEIPHSLHPRLKEILMCHCPCVRPTPGSRLLELGELQGLLGGSGGRSN